MAAALVVLALAVILAAVLVPGTDGATIHHVTGIEGKPLMFGPSLRNALPVGGIFKWVLVLPDPCAPKPTEVCVSVGHCFYDLVSNDNDSGCAKKGQRILTLALLTVDQSNDLRVIGPLGPASTLVRDDAEIEQARQRVTTGMGLTEDGDMSFSAVSKVNEGLYAVRVMGDGDSYMFYNVTVITGNWADGGPVIATVRHGDITHSIEPSEDHDHVSVSMPRMHVVGSHRTTVIRPKLAIAAASWRPEYNFTYEWYAIPYHDSCATLRLFEACVYHPSAPACLNPAGHRGCVVGTLVRKNIVGHVLMAHCRGSDLRTCKPSVISDKRKPMIFLGRTVPELCVESAAHIPSLYVMVVKIDDQVAGWAHTELVAARSSPLAVIDTHMPNPSHDHQDLSYGTEDEKYDVSDLDGGWDNDENSRKGKYPAVGLDVVAGVSVVLLILCGVVVCVVISRKCPRKKAPWLHISRKLPPRPPTPTYTSLPVDDVFFEDDYDEVAGEEEELIYENASRRPSTSSKKSSRSSSRSSTQKKIFGPSLSDTALSRFDKTAKIAMAAVADRLLANKALQSQRY